MTAYAKRTQRLLNAAGFGPLQEDGIFGPRSRSASNRAVDNRQFGTDWSLMTGAQQASLNKMGFGPLKVDGILGDNTRGAFNRWEASLGGSVPKAPAAPASGGLVRIIMHWTAGAHTSNPVDRRAYHFVIEGDGKVVPGNFKPESNIRPVRGGYAAHTLNLNTGSVGISLCAMAGARERPFNAGRFPVTKAQVSSLVKEVARLCKQYGIPVTRETVLSHAEVQPTLGVKQRNKWDFMGPSIPGINATGAVAIGDELREMVRKELEKM